MPPPLNAVYFNHGLESGPWGTKIRRLGRIARAMGFHIESPDYQGMTDPDLRVKKLLDLHPGALENLVLVGSSMGGYVAAKASETMNPQGLFLMAPAVYIDGFGKGVPVPRAGLTVTAHGWLDDVIPVDNAIRFSRERNIELYLLNCGHSMNRGIRVVEVLFEKFLLRVIEKD